MSAAGDKKGLVRVLRIVEIVGTPEAVAHQVAHSLHGVREFRGVGGDSVRITAVTLSQYPESIAEATAAAASPDSYAAPEIR